MLFEYKSTAIKSHKGALTAMSDTPQDESQIIEAYCVRCKQPVQMQDPEAVWTSRGTPGTRGECPECGGTVFRMGATHLHDGLERPEAVVVHKKAKRQKPKITPNTVYINYGAADEEMAQQIAADLNKLGLTTWLHDAVPDGVNWAGGVHPALKDCSRMVLVLSDGGAKDETTTSAWAFFKQKRKPVVIAQIGDVDPPDDLRRSPRFDVQADYKTALRALVQALSR
jgi:hypothetical protein